MDSCLDTKKECFFSYENFVKDLKWFLFAPSNDPFGRRKPTLHMNCNISQT